MKTAIIYYSKYGTTERVTRLIGDKLTNKVDYISLKGKHSASCVFLSKL